MPQYELLEFAGDLLGFYGGSPGGFLNGLLVSCNFLITTLITLELWKNRQQGVDVFALATIGLLGSCTLTQFLQAPPIAQLEAITFWKPGLDLLAFITAIAFLGFRHRYTLLVQSSRVLENHKQLEQRNLELAQVVDQRTQEIGQQSQQLDKILTELQQMQVNLIQLEKMSLVGQMVAGISYEISNPVNFIYGNLPYIEEYMEDLAYLVRNYQNFLREQGQTERLDQIAAEVDLEFILQDLPQVLNSVRQGTERIRGVVDNLENFYQIDATGMKLANLQSGIESTLTLLQNRYKKRIQIVRQFESIPLVECHPNQLNQVFLNLISNAIEVLLEHQSHLTTRQIVIGTRLTSNDRVAVTVSDNGTGMPQEVQEHLFEPFYTTKPTGIGTGLGLSISHYIITEVHQGRLYCCSAPGEGTTFIVELPIRQTTSLKNKHQSQIPPLVSPQEPDLADKFSEVEPTLGFRKI